MTDAAEVAALLDERPDLEAALRHVLAVDREYDTWTFDDLDIDSGSFGELVSNGVVEKVDGEYRLADPAAVERALGRGDETTSGAGASGLATPSLSLSTDDLSFDVDRVAAGTLVGLLAFAAVLRSVSFPAVFRDRVVLSGNDPYYYRYWVEQLLAQAGGNFDLSVLSDLPSGVANGEPLLVATLWIASTLFGGTPEAAGVVLALYPVVSAVVTALLVYLLALRVAADRRIALAAVALFAIIPAHALRTSLGFADHHAFDYPWLVLTALSFVALLGRETLDYGRSDVLAVFGLGIGITGQVLAWEAGPLLVLPLAVAVAAVVPVLTRRGESPLPIGVPVICGVGVAAILAAVIHVSFGWQSAAVAYTPALLLVGVVGVVGAGEAFDRIDHDLPTAVLAAAEVGVAVCGAVVVWVALPDLWTRFGSNVTGLFSSRGIVEVQSLFSGGSLGFLLLFGFVLVLGVPYMAWGTWRGYRGDARWLAVSIYGWYFVALSTLQLRFSGELSGFVAVFAGLGFVHLAERVDITDRPAPFRDAPERPVRADGGRLPVPDRTQLTAVVVLFLLVGSLGLVQVPIKVDQLTIPEEQYRTATAIETYSEERGLAYPQNYVYSNWGRNRMYNYFVSGEARSFAHARERFDDVDRTDQDTFVEQTDPEAAYGLVEDRRGFMVLERAPNAPPPTMQARLFRHHGSKFQGVPGLGHYQLIAASSDGNYKAFRIVPGATVTGPAPNELVRLSRQVDYGDSSFNYTRTAPVRHGVYTLTVPYPGTYRIGDRTVSVPSSAVENGGTVSGFSGPGVAYYSFDEGDGDRAYDRWGGSHARINEARWTDGASGNALRFNGTDSVATVQSNEALRVGEDESLTVSFHVRGDFTAGESRYPRVFQAGSGNGTIGVWARVPSEDFGVLISDDDGTRVKLFRIEEAAFDQWTEVTVVLDRTDEEVRLYRDGSVVAREPADQLGEITVDGPLTFGADRPDGAHRSSVTIDEFRMYKAVHPPQNSSADGPQTG